MYTLKKNLNVKDNFAHESEFTRQKGEGGID